MTVAFDRPFNQKIRINGLRLCGFAILPLVLFTASGWGGLGQALLHGAGTFCIVLAVLGRFWAILYIGGRKNREVMRDGPYSLCRHPLYLFSSIGAAGFGLSLGSLTLTALIGGVVFAIMFLTAAREEAFLHHGFGPHYDDYAAQVPRMVPTGRFHSPAKVSFDTDALMRNAADALVVLSLIPLAAAINWLHSAELLQAVRLP